MAFALPALPALTGLFGSTGTVATAATAASTLPAWLGYTSTALTALGGLTGAYGAIQTSNAQAASERYNAQVAQNNAQQATQNARIAGQSGAEQAAMAERKTRAEVGQLQANAAASGVDVNTGSALDVRSSASELGELDALTVRSNAAREAYGYQTQAQSFTTQSGLDEFAAENAKEAGGIQAGGTLLGAAATGTSNYLRYLQAGGFSG